LDPCTQHFNLVYEQTFSELRRFVACGCADPLSVSDLLQEIYLEYYRLLRQKGIAYVQNDAALLKRIAKRKLYRYYSFRELLGRTLPLFRTNDEDEEVADLPDESESVEEQALSAWELEQILAQLARYPAQTRKILYLHFVEEMTLSQIARQLGCGLSYVKNRLYRTLKELGKENGPHE